MKISDFSPLTQSSWLALGNGTVPNEFVSAFLLLEKSGLIGKTKGVVYDIGACVGHFTRKITHVFPGIKVIGFEAFQHHKPVHDFFEWDTHFVGLSNVNEKKTFYSTTTDFNNNMVGAGNSYYQENELISNQLYDETTEIQCYRLDDYVKDKDIPLPDFIKIDVQGAEKDIIEGGIYTFKHAKAALVEVQLVEYNKGAPLANEIIKLLVSIGYVKYMIVKKDNVQADILFIKEEIFEEIKSELDY